MRSSIAAIWHSNPSPRIRDLIWSLMNRATGPVRSLAGLRRLCRNPEERKLIDSAGRLVPEKQPPRVPRPKSRSPRKGTYADRPERRSR
jgi:hypothetical protein